MKLKSLSLPQSAVIASVIVILDQWTKWLIVRAFPLPPGVKPENHDPIPIVLIPNYLQLTFRVNHGAAFSSFQEHTFVLAIFSSIVAAVIAIWSWRLKPEELVLRLPLALIFGGAVGNLIDRFRLGYVIDFVDAHWQYKAHFATFNVADSGVCVGMGLLILLSFLAADPAKAPANDVSGNNPV